LKDQTLFQLISSKALPPFTFKGKRPFLKFTLKALVQRIPEIAESPRIFIFHHKALIFSETSKENYSGLPRVHVQGLSIRFKK